MAEQLGLVLTHAPTDSRLNTALRLLRAWQQSQLDVFGVFLQGDGVTLAQPKQHGASAAPLLNFCQQQTIAVTACVGSCQSRALCDPRGQPLPPDWDQRVTIAGLGELSAMLGECSRVIAL